MSCGQARGCENCTELFAAFVSKKTGKVHVILELCDLGNLQAIKKMSPVPEKMVACITKQCLLGLKHLHDHAIIHRDIKLENILICSDGRVKMADFGIARDVGGDMAFAATFVGTSVRFGFVVWFCGLVGCGAGCDCQLFGRKSPSRVVCRRERTTTRVRSTPANDIVSIIAWSA